MLPRSPTPHILMSREVRETRPEMGIQENHPANPQAVVYTLHNHTHNPMQLIFALRLFEKCRVGER